MIRDILSELPQEIQGWGENPAQVEQGTRAFPSIRSRHACHHTYVLYIRANHLPTIDAEVQVITLGREVAWVALPGEIFVQLGIAIKDASPFAVTSIHELANGSIGYVPTRQAYAQGNYEVISARCAEGSGELMVDLAIDQLRDQFNSKP